LDQFHTRGLAATAELAKLAGITADMSVLDVGSGVGGPARFLAATYGCRVTGVDLSESFVDAARYLTERTGQGGPVSFQTASALLAPSLRGRPLRRGAAAGGGEKHRGPGAPLPRDPPRADVRQQVCDLRHRVERRRAALSGPMGANAGNELSVVGGRDARGDRTGRFPHAGLAGRHRRRQGLDHRAARVGAAADAESRVRDGTGLRAARRQPDTQSDGRPARRPDRGVRCHAGQGLRRRRQMSTETLFRIHLVAGYVAWLLCFGVYVLPKLTSVD